MSKRILVVDDDVEFRAGVRTLLEGKGYSIAEAGKAREAISILGQENYDLAIVDGLLPDIDGVRLISQLRDGGNNIRIVFVSSFFRDLKTHRRLTKELGVALVTHKPIIPDVFAIQICNLLPLTEPEELEEPEILESSDDALAALREEYAELLPEMVQNLETTVREAQAKGGDSVMLADARMQAHRLRGTAAMYGFADVGDAAGRVEDAIVAVNEPDMAREKHPEWSELVDSLNDALEAAVEAREERQNSEFDGEAIKTSRVLVLDADGDVANQIEELGRREAAEVLVAATQSDALALAGSATPDAVVIDMGSESEDDLFSFVNQLRMVEGCGDLPIAFLSTDQGIRNQVAALHAGASLFLHKPYEIESLGVLLRQLLMPKEAGRPRIMLVDDDAHFTSATSKMLTAEGMYVAVYDDPFLAVDAVDTQRPDLILLDVEMPGLSGFDVCRIIRMTPRWQAVPVFFLTAHSDTQSRMAAFRAGGDDYLMKPVVEEELLARIKGRLDRLRLVRERAEKDVLTGLPTRRTFVEGLSAQIKELRQANVAMTVCLLDIDGFKGVNDNYGHMAGDEVLAALGNLLARRFRSHDLRARWGGEEFALAFPGADIPTVHKAMNRSLAEFAGMLFRGENQEEFSVTFSAGLVEFPTDGSTIRELLHAADRRLYDAKKAGRNRIVAQG